MYFCRRRPPSGDGDSPANLYSIFTQASLLSSLLALLPPQLDQRKRFPFSLHRRVSVEFARSWENSEESSLTTRFLWSFELLQGSSGHSLHLFFSIILAPFLWFRTSGILKATKPRRFQLNLGLNVKCLSACITCSSMTYSWSCLGRLIRTKKMFIVRWREFVWKLWLSSSDFAQHFVCSKQA